MALLKKLKNILTQRFPPPDKVSLQEHDGIFGAITSSRFRRMDTIDRQDLIGEILGTNLNPEERRQVQVIVAVTPEEETGFMSGGNG